jgi:hypothetical protein
VGISSPGESIKKIKEHEKKEWGYVPYECAGPLLFGNLEFEI